MGKLRKTLAIGAIAGLVVPPIVAGIAKERIVPVNDEEADEVALVTIFDGGRFTSRSEAFRGGTALCWYGGSDIDLREARLDAAGASLHVRAIFGGVRVIVPDGWHVRVRSTPILAGVSDDTGGGDPAGPTLEIDALAVFAGVQVTNRLADDDELITPPGVPIAAKKDDGRGRVEDRADVLARAEVEAGAEAEASVAAVVEGVGEGDGEALPEAEANVDLEADAGAEAPPVTEAPADEADRDASGAG